MSKKRMRCCACKDCAIAYVEHIERQENAAESFEANA